MAKSHGWKEYYADGQNDEKSPASFNFQKGLKEPALPEPARQEKTAATGDPCRWQQVRTVP
jgi:hypothetical protein